MYGTTIFFLCYTCAQKQRGAYFSFGLAIILKKIDVFSVKIQRLCYTRTFLESNLFYCIIASYFLVFIDYGYTQAMRTSDISPLSVTTLLFSHDSNLKISFFQS